MAGRIAVFAATIEGLGIVFLEVKVYSLGNINLFSHIMIKVSHPFCPMVNKHRIAWSVLQWVMH